MGIAYHANYLNWFEVTRTEFIRSLGLSYRDMEANGLLLPVVEANCRYLKPALYDDVLQIELRLTELGAASLRFAYDIRRQTDDSMIAHGWTRQAFVSANLKPLNAKRSCYDVWSRLAPLVT